jgi:hypothetical protein
LRRGRARMAGAAFNPGGGGGEERHGVLQNPPARPRPIPNQTPLNPLKPPETPTNASQNEPPPQRTRSTASTRRSRPPKRRATRQRPTPSSGRRGRWGGRMWGAAGVCFVWGRIQMCHTETADTAHGVRMCFLNPQVQKANKPRRPNGPQPQNVPPTPSPPSSREELVRQLRSRARTSRRSGWLGGGKLTRAEVSEPDVARVISKWTGGGG